PFRQRRKKFSPRPRRRGWIWLAAAGISLAALAFLIFHPPMSHPGPPVLRRLTTDGGFTGYPAVSKDGKWIAFASDRGHGNLAVWVMPSGDPSQARQLTDDQSN